MEIFELFTNIKENSRNIKECKNFYFENHICEKSGNNKKINLEFKLSNDNTDKIIKFGICKECNTIFYCNDFESNSF